MFVIADVKSPDVVFDQTEWLCVTWASLHLVANVGTAFYSQEFIMNLALKQQPELDTCQDRLGCACCLCPWWFGSGTSPAAPPPRMRPGGENVAVGPVAAPPQEPEGALQGLWRQRPTLGGGVRIGCRIRAKTPCDPQS